MENGKYPNYILEYYNDIVSGKIVVSKKIRKLYETMVDNINNPKNDFIFNPFLANRPVEFIERFCKNSKAPFAGKPVTLMLWEKAFLSCIFGFVDKDTKLRQYHEVFLEVARKNGKSTLLACISLYCMFEEAGSQVITAANTLSQASDLYNESYNMVLQSSLLKSKIKKRKNDLYIDDNFGLFKAITSNPKTHDGLNCSCGILDECHEQKNRDLYDIILQSQSTRTQPLMFAITTNGFVRNGLFDNLYEYGEKVINGEVTDSGFIGFFYELDSTDEIEDESCWIKCNPSLGKIKKLSTLKRSYQKSISDPSYKRTCYTKDFNIPMTQNGSMFAFLPYDVIHKSRTQFDISQFAGSYCEMGLDLSLCGDLSAITLLLQQKGSNTLYFHQQYFLPDKQIESHTEAPYQLWADQGWLTLCKNSTQIKLEDIVQYFVNVVQAYKIMPISCGYDRWGSQYLVDILTDKGFNVENVGQGYKSLSNPMKVLRGLFIDDQVRYDSPITEWNLSNCIIDMDEAENWKPTKLKRNMRIDGVSSMIDSMFVYEKEKNDFLSLIK
jgi:phage terminase large subunit-like protein